MTDQPAATLAASVVVCTCNRSALLIEACEAILGIDYPAAAWELVIVDNRSRDDTLEVARGIAARHPRRVRVIEEREIGLSAARNAGIRSARGALVAFVDDDAFPVAGWLTALERAFDDPRVLAAGGPVAPLFSGALPSWVDGRFLPYLTAWDLGSEPRPLCYNEYPRGANVAFRRRVFERFGGFSTHLGRKGSSLRSCEETELCLRIERGGGSIVYVPGAGVGHRVHAERITEAWMRARFAAQGRSEAIIDWMHGGLAGLRRGLARFRRQTRSAERDDALLGRCHRHAYRAYAWSAWRCPLRVRRYRPAAGTAPWSPPG